MSAVDDAVAALRRTGVQVDAPVGTVRTTVRTTADDGWLLFNQTVLNAQSIYPALWAVVPTGYKSGSSLVLPTRPDHVNEGAGDPAGVGNAGDVYWDRTNLRQWLSDGVGWIILSEPSQAYTPVFAGTAIGNGTVAGVSHRSDGYCDWSAKFTLGSTSTVTGPITVNAPYAYLAGGGNGYDPFKLGAFDSSAAQIYLCMTYASNPTGTTVGLYYVTTGTTGTLTNFSASGPFVWAVSDALHVSGRFQMSSRYTTVAGSTAAAFSTYQIRAF
jgi:hypothetical protein